MFKSSPTSFWNVAGSQSAREENKVDNIVWSAELTKEMVEHLDDEQLDLLVKYLEDAVFQLCQEYGIQ